MQKYEAFLLGCFIACKKACAARTYEYWGAPVPVSMDFCRGLQGGEAFLVAGGSGCESVSCGVP